MRTQVLVATALVGVAAWGSPAFAQLSGLPSIPGIIPLPAVPLAPDQLVGEEEGPVTVLLRQRPEFQPQPLTYKGINFYPSLFEIGTFDSNIFASRANVTSDFVFRTRPDLHVDNGNASSMKATFDMYGEDDRYVSHGNLSNDNAGASLNLANDFGNGNTGLSTTSFTYAHQDPAGLTTNAAGGALRSLPALSIFSQELGVDHEFDPLGLILDGSYTRNDFENVELASGGSLNQTQLNSNVFKVGPKVAYNVAPDLRPYVSANYARYAYDNGVLSANEYQGVFGADFRLRQLLSGTAFAGYKDHVYDSSATPNAAGPTFGANVTWYATEVLTLSATASQGFYDTTITLANGGHSTINDKALAAEADYEALTNVIVSGLVSYENNDYRETTRTDNVYSAGIGAQYLISPMWTALAQYQYSLRDSTVSLDSYQRHTISVGLKLSF